MRHLLEVLYKPRATFEQLRDKGDWIAPLLVLGLVMGAYQLFLKQSAFSLGTAIGVYVGAMVGIGVGLLLNVLLLFIVRWMLRTQAGTFLQLFKVALFSLAPNMLYMLIVVGLVILGGADSLLDDSVFDMVMDCWGIYLMAIGTAVILEKPVFAVLWRLLVIALSLAIVLMILGALFYVLFYVLAMMAPSLTA